MKKLYYDRAPDAIIMARDFDVKFNISTCFGSGENLGYMELCKWLTEQNLWYVEDIWYRVSPDSLSIFEPQKGDCVKSRLMGMVYTVASRESLTTIQEGSSEHYKIIQRNSKPFIMPEVEND